MTGIRVVIGVIIGAIVLVGLLPMLVLLDLVSGGDGWGLCPSGVGSCHTSYFDGPELAAGLALIMFLLLALLRIAVRTQRMMVSRRDHRPLARSVGRRSFRRPGG
ncbi:MAG: hypothetical protein ACE5KX_02435 [Acidimicrobiia bacterium]